MDKKHWKALRMVSKLGTGTTLKNKVRITREGIATATDLQTFALANVGDAFDWAGVPDEVDNVLVDAALVDAFLKAGARVRVADVSDLVADPDFPDFPEGGDILASFPFDAEHVSRVLFATAGDITKPDLCAVTFELHPAERSVSIGATDGKRLISFRGIQRSGVEIDDAVVERAKPNSSFSPPLSQVIVPESFVGMLLKLKLEQPQMHVEFRIPGEQHGDEGEPRHPRPHALLVQAGALLFSIKLLSGPWVNRVDDLNPEKRDSIDRQAWVEFNAVQLRAACAKMKDALKLSSGDSFPVVEFNIKHGEAVTQFEIRRGADMAVLRTVPGFELKAVDAGLRAPAARTEAEIRDCKPGESEADTYNFRFNIRYFIEAVGAFSDKSNFIRINFYDRKPAVFKSKDDPCMVNLLCGINFPDQYRRCVAFEGVEQNA